MARSSCVQISGDTRSRDGDFKDNTVFGAVDENEDKIEEFEKVVGEQKKKLELQQKVIEEQNRKLSRFERSYDESQDLEL